MTKAEWLMYEIKKEIDDDSGKYFSFQGEHDTEGLIKLAQRIVALTANTFVGEERPLIREAGSAYPCKSEYNERISEERELRDELIKPV